MKTSHFRKHNQYKSAAATVSGFGIIRFQTKFMLSIIEYRIIIKKDIINSQKSLTYFRIGEPKTKVGVNSHTLSFRFVQV